MTDEFLTSLEETIEIAGHLWALRFLDMQTGDTYTREKAMSLPPDVLSWLDVIYILGEA